MLPELNLHGLPSHVDLQNYLGLWAIEESAFSAQWLAVTKMDLLSHIAAANVRTEPASTKPSLGTDIAVIQILGTMTKGGSSMSDAGSTLKIRQQVRAALNNDAIGGVMIVIESPGGTVNGTAELANDLAALSAAKPTVTFAEDLMASAGLWAGLMSRKVFANNDHATIGSMGVYLGLYDMTGAAEQQGIRPVVIRTGDLKGAGFPGTEITDDQKAMYQNMVNAAHDAFTSSVKAARNLTDAQMAELSRGGVYSAKAAIGLGLIDGVRSYEAAVAELRSMMNPKRKGMKMSDEKPTAASLADLESACAGADEKFLLNQLRSGASVGQAANAWMRSLAADNADLKSKLAASEADAAKLKGELDAEKAKKPAANGTHRAQPDVPNAAADESVESATVKFNAAVADLIKGGATKAKAISKVASGNPELHKAYLAEVNSRV